MGRLSRSLAKMVRKGQAMVVPVDEMIRPSSINQNWGGYFLTIREVSLMGWKSERQPHR